MFLHVTFYGIFKNKYPFKDSKVLSEVEQLNKELKGDLLHVKLCVEENSSGTLCPWGKQIIISPPPHHPLPPSL